ncbi:MAG: hypothetical protein Q9163_003570 [Psora crenata]
MIARTVGRAVSNTGTNSYHLPPTFLLPLRCHLSTISTATTRNDPSPPLGAYTSTSPSDTSKHPIGALPSTSHATPDYSPRCHHPQLSRRSPLPPPTNPLSTSLSLLPLLAAQPPHYIIAHIHARPYLLTPGDTLRLPFHMPHAPPGTVIRLNRASMLGSRDFTFRGNPWVDEKFWKARAVVVGIEGEPMRVIKKTKRRQRKVKTVKSKMRFTVLRVQQLEVLPEGAKEEDDAREPDRKENGMIDEKGHTKSVVRPGVDEAGDSVTIEHSSIPL